MSLQISCVIPVFNGERFLAQALDSVMAQTLAPAEVIIVDDGSTDATADVLARFGDRVTVFHQANAGPAAARNRGLALSNSPYVAFQDADDVWHPEKLARQAARFEARPELEACITHVQNFWEAEARSELEAMPEDHPLRKAAIPGHTMQTLMVARSAFERIGPLDESLRFGEDIEWFMRGRDNGLVLELLDDVLLKRRLHATNLTRSAEPRQVHAGLVDSLTESLRRRRAAKQTQHAGDRR